MYRNKEEFVYMDCVIRMSNRAMADLLYATIMTHAAIITTFTIGGYEYSREQNRYNLVNTKIFIHPNEIERFEEIAKAKLEKPIEVSLNSN